MINKDSYLPSSFRDPSGYVFFQNGVLCRQINRVYKDAFQHLMASGLYDELTSSGLLVQHKEAPLTLPNQSNAYKVIIPEPIAFISYPYEWCFSQLKAAALATLKIQKKALAFGMVLKDASAYNIQFKEGQPIFIDTLSFELYTEGKAWGAYRQFCQHFLAPLALIAHCDFRLSQLLQAFIDGIPLDLAVKLLPVRTKLNPSLFMHLHLHAKSQAKYSDSHQSSKLAARKSRILAKPISRKALMDLIDSLTATVDRLTWKPLGTEWGAYYDDTNYSADAMQNKKTIVTEFIDQCGAKAVWDFGGNTGYFSRIASGKKIPTVSFDVDPAAVESNYGECIRTNDQNLLPLVVDLTNPSPSIGWQHEERASIIARGPTDTVLALALIHHLAISNNVPLSKIAAFFSQVCHSLIIEFVPKNDSQVQRLLSSREDIFPDYTQNAFESEFRNFFTIQSCKPIGGGSQRTLYSMTTKVPST